MVCKDEVAIEDTRNNSLWGRLIVTKDKDNKRPGGKKKAETDNKPWFQREQHRAKPSTPGPGFLWEWPQPEDGIENKQEEQPDLFSQLAK